MDAIDRRTALRGMMCIALAAGFGAALLPNTVEAMPLALQKDLGSKADVFEAKPQPIASRPPRRPMTRPRRPIHRRQRPRRVCWWHRGRRVCRWRY
jgi:hypothetical protein